MYFQNTPFCTTYCNYSWICRHCCLAYIIIINDTTAIRHQQLQWHQRDSASLVESAQPLSSSASRSDSHYSHSHRLSSGASVDRLTWSHTVAFMSASCVIFIHSCDISDPAKLSKFNTFSIFVSWKIVPDHTKCGFQALSFCLLYTSRCV